MPLSQPLPVDTAADPAPSRTREGARPLASADGFAEIFADNAPYVVGLLRRLGVREADVEDVAQDVFLAVHRQLSDFEGRSTLRTWICGIAVRAAHNHTRRAYRRREVPSVLTGGDREPRLDAPQLRRVEAMQEAATLLAALDVLTTKQREVFVLYEIEQLPMREVARLLGCPRFTAYTRLRGARAQVQRHFTRRHPPGETP